MMLAGGTNMFLCMYSHAYVAMHTCMVLVIVDQFSCALNRNCCRISVRHSDAEAQGQSYESEDEPSAEDCSRPDT